MKKLILSALPGLAATLVCFGALAVAQPPDRESAERPRPEGQAAGKSEDSPERRPERRREGRPAGRPDGRPGQLGGRPGPMFRPGMILPPFVVEQLDLTADQQEKLEALQSEVRTQLDKILTTEQKDQLRVMAERGPMMPGGRPGGPGFGRGPGRERPEGAGPGEPRRRERNAGEPRRRDGEERARPDRPRRPEQAERSDRQAERGERAERPERDQPEREAAEKAAKPESEKPESEKPDADQ